MRFFSIFFYYLILVSCSNNVSYNPGLYLKEISGKIILTPYQQNPNFFLENCFLLVLVSNSIGISLNEQIYQKTAYIEKINRKGEYKFAVKNKGQIFELNFFCKNYQIQLAQFQQTLGVQKINYTPNLKKDNSWNNSYFLSIRPFLENILSEERYLLPKLDAFFLSEWMQKIEKDNL